MRILFLTILVTSFSCTHKLNKNTQFKSNPLIEKQNVFSYKSSLSLIERVAECANAVSKDKTFKDEIMKKCNFDYTQDKGKHVFERMVNHHCVIRSYKTRNPWSKVNATTYKSNDVDLYLNMRKKRTLAQWVGTTHHECSHNYGYSHGDNNPKGKQNSVPYWLGALAEQRAKVVCE
jgi:hypothetical protein